MDPIVFKDWKPAELDRLFADIVQAVESGEIDSAFDNIEMTAGTFARSKNTKNFTKNYLLACIRAGVQGVSEASPDTALGMVNAYRLMNSQAPLDALPDDYKVVAVKVPHEQGNPDVEIYIKKGNRVLYGEKVLPRGVLAENFLNINRTRGGSS